MISTIKDNTKDKLRLTLLGLLILLTFSIPFGINYSRPIVVITFIVWLFFVKKDYLADILKNKIVMSIFLYVLMLTISLLWSEHVFDGLHYIRRLFSYLIIPMFMIMTVVKENELKYLLLAFLTAMFINEVISYLIYFGLYESRNYILHGFVTPFIHHVPYGVLVAFTIILITNHIKQIKNNFQKVIYIIFLITMLTNLLISGARTAYIAFFITVVFLLFTYYRPSLKNLVVILILPIFIFVIGYNFETNIQKRVHNIFNSLELVYKESNYDSSLGARLSMYPTSYDILKQEHNSFIFGVGTGDIYPEMLASLERTNILNWKIYHLHSSYLEAYLNAGILGLIFFMNIFYRIWKLKLKDEKFMLIKSALVVLILVTASASKVFHTKEMLIFISVFVSIFILKSFSENKLNRFDKNYKVGDKSV